MEFTTPEQKQHALSSRGRGATDCHPARAIVSVGIEHASHRGQRWAKLDCTPSATLLSRLETNFERPDRSDVCDVADQTKNGDRSFVKNGGAAGLLIRAVSE
jgi:hypothetical protein